MKKILSLTIITLVLTACVEATDVKRKVKYCHKCTNPLKYEKVK